MNLLGDLSLLRRAGPIFRKKNGFPSGQPVQGLFTSLHRILNPLPRPHRKPSDITDSLAPFRTPFDQLLHHVALRVWIKIGKHRASQTSQQFFAVHPRHHPGQQSGNEKETVRLTPMHALLQRVRAQPIQLRQPLHPTRPAFDHPTLRRHPAQGQSESATQLAYQGLHGTLRQI